MADDAPNVDEIRDTVISQIVDGGYVTAIPIVILSLYLFVQGYRRLSLITAIAGAAIGYLSASTLYPFILDLGLAITLDRFQLFSAMAFAIIAVMITSMSIRLLATGFAFIVISNGIQLLKNYGINPERGELLPGITAIIAFFIGMSFRHILPPIVAALLASIGLYVGACIILDLPMEYLNLESSLAPLLVIPSVIVSLLVQRWHKKRNSPDDIATNEARRQQQARGGDFRGGDLRGPRARGVLHLPLGNPPPGRRVRTGASERRRGGRDGTGPRGRGGSARW